MKHSGSFPASSPPQSTLRSPLWFSGSSFTREMAVLGLATQGDTSFHFSQQHTFHSTLCPTKLHFWDCKNILEQSSQRTGTLTRRKRLCVPSSSLGIVVLWFSVFFPLDSTCKFEGKLVKRKSQSMRTRSGVRGTGRHWIHDGNGLVQHTERSVQPWFRPLLSFFKTSDTDRTKLYH